MKVLKKVRVWLMGEGVVDVGREWRCGVVLVEDEVGREGAGTCVVVVVVVARHPLCEVGRIPSTPRQSATS